MADPVLDTATQRPATGLDRGARKLILGITGEPAFVVAALFANGFADLDDYLDAIEQVWGGAKRHQIAHAVADAEADAAMSTGLITGAVRQRGRDAAMSALLLVIPEPDFQLAVETALRSVHRSDEAARPISEICKRRGAPWIFDQQAGFVWVGDEVIEHDVLAPALTILADRRFAGGVRSEFETARSELRTGTHVAFKQCVVEAACAVESAMKVVCDEHRISYDERDTAQKLFEHLVAAGLVPKRLERLLLAAATPRNKSGGHGAGAVAHDVSRSEAESVLAAAGVAIVHLGKLLP